MAGGDGITKRLRHVTDEMKAYKQNREYGEVDFEDLDRRKAAAEARRAEKEAKKLADAQAAEQAKSAASGAAPIFQLEGLKRWVVRNQAGSVAQQKTLEITNATMGQAVHVQQCSNLLLVVKCKINSVLIVDCKKVQVSLQSVVSSVEIINSQSVDVQVAGVLPSAVIENTHTMNLYLLDAESARQTEIVASASSAMNVNFPDENDSSDIVERALPEQFISKIVPNGKGGYKLETKPSEIC